MISFKKTGIFFTPGTSYLGINSLESNTPIYSIKIKNQHHYQCRFFCYTNKSKMSHTTSIYLGTLLIL